MKKFLILAAAAVLVLGMLAMAQSGDKQQAPAAPNSPAMVPGQGDQPEMMPGPGLVDEFDLADDQADDGGDDVPMMAENFRGPGGPGQMMRGGMRHPGMPFGGMMMGAMAEKLQLTDAQKSQFKKLRTDFELAQVDKRAEAQKAQIRLRELMRDDKSAEADVMKGIDEVARVRTEIAKARFSHMRAMHAVLTDSQRETLKTLRQNRMQGGMWGHRGMNGGFDSTPSGQNQSPRHGRGM
jgi:Spy/CpxP family protein refolding chaperone